MIKVTFCITSCNRNDLLFKTLNSFLKVNTYPIHKWLLREDSGIDKVSEEIKKAYPFIEVLSGENVGQGKSIDILYDLVDTEYIFHCEEDWLFEGDSKFIEQSIKVLEAHKEVNQVWLRKHFNQWNEGNFIKLEDFEFCYINQNHLEGWNGFSWNPGLRRLSDYKKMFPDGFFKFAKVYKSGGALEKECMMHTKQFNYRAAILKDCVCSHIGHLKPTKK